MQEIEIPKNNKINNKNLKKMLFINNALDNGWSVKKSDDKYVFAKKHENKREILQESYLENFILENMDVI